MKKTFVLFLVVALLFGIIAIAGCGGDKTVTEEDVTITEKNGDVTITDEEGKETYTESLSEEDLGVPIYPGSKMSEGDAGSVTTETAGEATTVSGAVLFTTDPLDKVIAWYKDELQGKAGFTDTSMSAEGETVGMFSYMDGEEMKTIIIGEADDTDGTEIIVSSSTGYPEMPDLP